jgi:ATP-dependent exoDNAse (exonuclease V) beta subunit
LARQRALDPTTSFIVQAPAGSGKTELLIQRFLTLLARVQAPEEVVAITFTRKAAAEMRKRVLDALAAASACKPAQSEQERITLALAEHALHADEAHAWGLIDNPARLRILTIDALCLSIVAQMPLLSRMGAVPAPVDDATDIYREAARETLAQLEHAQWTDQVAALLWHLDNDSLRAQDMLARLLARRDQWLRHGPVCDREALTRAFVNLNVERMQQVTELMPARLARALIECARYAAYNLAQTNPQSPVVACGSLTALPPARPDALAAWRGLAHLVLRRDGEVRLKVNVSIGFPAAREQGVLPHELRRRDEAKQRMEWLLVELSEVAGLRDAMADVRLLPDPGYSDEQWRVIEALYGLLPLALAQLALAFRRHGAVDFTELLIAANHALGEPDAPTDLALSLDYRIGHLLIDEFQDTSLSQYELLQRLTAGWQSGDGRTLFAVGDPMQSIYRFRQAEVGLFLRARSHGLGGVMLEPLALACNFRSLAGIVEWINRVFEQVLPMREDLASGAVPYSHSLARLPHGASESVSLHALPHSAGAAEARRVVDIAREELALDATRTVAILVRSRNHLSQIVPALKAAGLRFRAIEIEALTHRPAVQDLHALARALLHPADAVAWLALLRAPWCALSVLDLERLAAEQSPAALWWARINDPACVHVISSDGQARVARLAAALAPIVENRGRAALRDRIEGAWLRLGGPASVQEPTDLEDVKVYLDLVESMELGGDLEDLAGLEQELLGLFAVPDVQAPDRLQVMTIHKAKGLEFDVVILPGLARASRKDEPELMRWLERPSGEGESDLLLAAITASGSDRDPLYACVTRLLDERQRHEDARLLYVASTRARERLHLVAELKHEDQLDQPPAPVKPDDRALLRKLWPVLEDELRQAFALSAGDATSRQSASVDPMMYPLRRMPLDWRPIAVPPAVVWQQPPAVEDDRDDTVEFSWAGETARHVGTVVHQFLQQIAQEGVQSWNDERVGAQTELARAALQLEGVATAELSGAQERVLRALRNCLRDERGRWVLSNMHRDSRCEYRLAGEIDGGFVNVTLDRTFVDDKGVRWIVDYKTSTHEGAGVENFLDSERERYRPQLERYARLAARLDRRRVRLGLYFPLLNGWREWEAGERQLSLPI